MTNMKKIFTIMAVSLALTANANMPVPTDSVAENLDVVIIDDNGGDEIIVVETAQNGVGVEVPSNPVMPEISDKKWEFSTGGVGIGFLTPIGVSEGVDLRTSRSSEIQWLEVLSFRYTPRPGGLTYSIGLGFDWRNYGLGKEHRLDCEDNVVYVTDWGENVQKNHSSRIKVTSLTMPLMVRVPIVGKFAIKAGAVVNFNVHKSLKATYDLPDRHVTEFVDGMKINPVTVDLMAAATYKGVGLYFKYAPMRVLKSGYGPKFNSISFGLMFLW